MRQRRCSVLVLCARDMTLPPLRDGRQRLSSVLLEDGIHYIVAETHRRRRGKLVTLDVGRASSANDHIPLQRIINKIVEDTLADGSVDVVP